MKKFIAVSLALGVAFALTPFAWADSFGFQASGSIVAANSAFGASPTGLAKGGAESSAFVPSGEPGSLGARRGAFAAFGYSAREAVNAGVATGTSALSGDGGFLFENLFYPGNLGIGTSTTADVLVDTGGHELNLLSGHFDGYKTGGRGNEHFYFADGGSYRVSNENSKGNSKLDAATATLAATPEPGSLVLLGTGLLCLALFLFRKSGKHTTES
jgi:hypothetical protein